MNNYKIVKNTEWKEVDINGATKEIPITWNVSELKEIVKINGNKKPKNLNLIKYIDISCIKKNKIINFNVYKDSFPSRAQNQIKKNDIIISTVRPNLKTYCYIDEKFNDYICSSGFAVLSANSNLINSKFLFNIVKLESTTNYLIEQSIGGVYPSFNASILNDFEVSYPHLSQQTSIATILSAQESIINDMETLIEKYETRLKYLSEELLSGRLRIKEVDGKTFFYKNKDWKEVEINGEMKEIPVDWKVNKVSDIFEIQRGSVLSKDYIRNNSGIYPVYSSATENDGSIGNIKTYMFDGEYLTWNTDGYAGSIFYRNGKFNCTNICGVLKAKININLYALRIFMEPRFKKNVIHGGQLTNLKLMSSTVSNIDFAYPKNEELQVINSVFFEHDLLITSQKQLLEKEKKKFTLLLNNLLSGNYLVESIVNEI